MTASLEQLQALWAPPVVVVPEVVQSEPLERCWHNDHDEWVDEPDRFRRGWIKTTCGECGGFVGYRPADPEKLKGKRPKAS